jgi:hypothetical protein
MYVCQRMSLHQSDVSPALAADRRACLLPRPPPCGAGLLPRSLPPPLSEARRLFDLALDCWRW